MTERRRVVRVPASSANLGPGYDVLAAALSIALELEVAEQGQFSVDAGADLPTDRSNLCVRAFERLHPADGLRFEIRSEIPLARGLGSSAAAIVAGLVAADHLFELGLERDEIYRHAVQLEGHPDNVAAALYGGFVLCPGADGAADLPAPVRLAVPEGVEAVLVIPDDTVPTAAARAALPASVALADAVANVAAATQLVLGLERSDLALIARGLADRLHQPAREPLYRALDGAARPRARARRARRDHLGGRTVGDALGASGRTPARSSRCASGPAAGPRYAGCRSRRLGADVPSRLAAPTSASPSGVGTRAAKPSRAGGPEPVTTRLDTPAGAALVQQPDRRRIETESE